MLGETVDSFWTALFALIEHCDFGTFKTRLIWDRFIVDLEDKTLFESLQFDAALTLETAITKVCQKEAVHLQQDLFHVDNNNRISVIQK